MVHWYQRRISTWNRTHIELKRLHWRDRCIRSRGCIHTGFNGVHWYHGRISTCISPILIFTLLALGRVHTLNLSFCTGMTDVSALGTVHTLNLSHCTSVIDTSALGHVHLLDISDCNGIIDVLALY